MKRVLITGGSGALGQAVIEHIKQLHTYQIYMTSSRSDLNHDKIMVKQCDLRNAEQLQAALNWAQPDLILHLAARFIDDLSEAYSINVAPASGLLQFIYEQKTKTRVVLIGSAAEYGAVQPDENPINEMHTLFPVSVYGVTKAWQTQLLGLYANRGVDVICARIFNLFGPGISDKLFAGRMQKQIAAIKSNQQAKIEVGSLNAIRDYISTQAAARQLLTIAEYGDSGNIYHIGSGQAISMREFLIEQLKLHGLSSSIIHEAPAHSNRHGYDVPVIFADMHKTNQLEKQKLGIING